MSAWIKLNNVSIDIPIYTTERSFRSTLVSKYLGGNIKTDHNRIRVQALRNINFSLKAGDRLGLVGHNGSGKSTLLHTMAGIYKPFAGTVEYNGTIIPLFNFSPGMDHVDTGLDNIFTVGMFFGKTKKQIEEKLDDIIAFTELQDFIHLPVRTYSNGMVTRLSFGIATCLQPDILLLDEGIGVGDDGFARKAKAHLENSCNNIQIMVLASHSRELIKKLCNKAILLDHGNMLAFDTVDNVFELYDQRAKLESV